MKDVQRYLLAFVLLLGQGLVVQLALTVHGLKFSPVFQFMHFCMSVYFKTSEKRTFIHPDEISEEIFLHLHTSCGEVCFEFYVNPGLN